MEQKTAQMGRRGFLAALLAIPLVAILLRRIRPTGSPDVVEVDGWLLRRDDFGGDLS